MAESKEVTYKVLKQGALPKGFTVVTDFTLTHPPLLTSLLTLP